MSAAPHYNHRRTQKLVGLTLTVPERAKETLDKQARARGMTTSQWAGLVFDMGFAAICARDKSMPIADDDLDAIVGATLLLKTEKNWSTADVAKKLGVSEAVVSRILDGWRDYRRGGVFGGGA